MLRTNEDGTRGTLLAQGKSAILDTVRLQTIQVHQRSAPVDRLTVNHGHLNVSFIVHLMPDAGCHWTAQVQPGTELETEKYLITVENRLDGGGFDGGLQASSTSREYPTTTVTSMTKPPPSGYGRGVAVVPRLRNASDDDWEGAPGGVATGLSSFLRHDGEAAPEASRVAPFTAPIINQRKPWQPPRQTDRVTSPRSALTRAASVPGSREWAHDDPYSLHSLPAARMRTTSSASPPPSRGSGDAVPAAATRLFDRIGCAAGDIRASARVLGSDMTKPSRDAPGAFAAAHATATHPTHALPMRASRTTDSILALLQDQREASTWDGPPAGLPSPSFSSPHRPVPDRTHWPVSAPSAGVSPWPGSQVRPAVSVVRPLCACKCSVTQACWILLFFPSAPLPRSRHLPPSCSHT